MTRVHMASEDEAVESIEEEVDYSKWTDEQLVEAGWTAQQVVDLKLENTEAEVTEEEPEAEAEVTE